MPYLPYIFVRRLKKTWTGDYGFWYDSFSFEVDAVVPVLLSPTNASSVVESTPEYEWEETIGASWYQLRVYNGSGDVILNWYQVGVDVTCSGACTLNPGVALPDDFRYDWTVRPWTGDYGNWYPELFFVTDLPGIGSFFNNIFPGGWSQISGSWWNDYGEYLTTQGLENLWSSMRYVSDPFTKQDYEVMLYRSGCLTCSNSLIVRGNSTPLAGDKSWDDAYVFQYLADGGYSVWKQVNGSWEWLQPWTPSPSIKTGGAWNKLRVVANGSDLAFYINGALVWSGTDASLTSGSAGIMMYSDGAEGDQLWVDYATLSIPESALAAGKISAEQQALNEAANRNEATDDLDQAGRAE